MSKKICIIDLFFFLFCYTYSLPPLFSEEQNNLIEPFKVTSVKNSKSALTSTLVEFETERGVNLRYVLITPENPYAIAILLPGGAGTLNISGSTDDFVIGAQEDFMVRNRNYFAESGLRVALLDAPSDMQPGGMTPGLRVSEEHSKDIFDVITRVREESVMPVWLIGISMATYSASSNAIQLKDDIQGLVLASSSTQPTSEGNGYIPYPNGILDLELGTITAPTLILAHENDECPGTPPSGAEKIKDELINSSSVEIKYFTDGNEPESVACGPLSPHCFYGIDTEVVSAIASFIIASPLSTTTSVTSTISTSTTTTTKGRCMFETIYGVDSDEVALLKSFRDKILLKTPEGQEITGLYYQLNPSLIEAIKDEKFKKEVTTLITDMLSLIKNGVEDSSHK